APAHGAPPSGTSIKRRCRPKSSTRSPRNRRHRRGRSASGPFSRHPPCFPFHREETAVAGLERLLAAISNFLLLIAGIAITLMMLHVGIDILSKVLFNRPVVATLEI